MQKGLCSLVCKDIAETHNSRAKLKLDPGYQVKLGCIVEELGSPKPVTTGSWKSKSGHLYKRYLINLLEIKICLMILYELQSKHLGK
jgi:hypothetical protein